MSSLVFVLGGRRDGGLGGVGGGLNGKEGEVEGPAMFCSWAGADFPEDLLGEGAKAGVAVLCFFERV